MCLFFRWWPQRCHYISNRRCSWSRSRYSRPHLFLLHPVVEGEAELHQSGDCPGGAGPLPTRRGRKCPSRLPAGVRKHARGGGSERQPASVRKWPKLRNKIIEPRHPLTMHRLSNMPQLAKALKTGYLQWQWLCVIL